MNPIRKLYAEAEADTGIVVDWDKTVQPAIDAGRVLIHYSLHSKEPVGFLQWVEVADPDTHEVMWIERMLWVRPEARGTTAAAWLISKWKHRARRAGSPISLVAGASIADPEIARRLYQGLGFNVTYGFKKRMNDV